jgi:acetyltransferase-like isoleucine patch superfamily enzyme
MKLKTIHKVIVFLCGEVNNFYNLIRLTMKKVEYTSKPIIKGQIFITGHGVLRLGSGVRINSSLSSNPIGGDTRCIFSMDSGTVISIGNNVGISNSALICKEKITIADNVIIGGGCKIYDSDFHSLDFDIRMSREDIPKKAEVVIKNGAFIGGHSIILKGVTIGEKSIVGAGSVITKDIPDGEIWAGNPARYIKKINLLGV